MAKLIELKGISKSYDDEKVLNCIDLYIRDKEFITLLGPSGCGKTTTLRIIGGFEVAGFKLNMGMIKNVYGLAKGFTVKRIFSMLGGKFTKEQILEINTMLNKVKKPKK